MQTQQPHSVGIVNFALQYPYFIVIGTLILGIMGALSLVDMPKDLLPVGKNPAVQILTFYPGMPTSVVEKDITARVELYTIQAVGIKAQESRSLPGVSVVKNYFNPEISLDNAIAQTSSLLTTTIRKLPPGTQPPLILPFDPAASTPLALVTLSGDVPEKTLRDLGRYDVSNAIKAIPGAMAPIVMGGADRQILLMLDPKKMSAYHFSPFDVLEKMLHLNTLAPSGEVSIGEKDYQIMGNGLALSVNEMNEYPLRSFYGTTIKVKDIGEVKDAEAIQTNVVMVGDKRQVYVPVFRQPGANSLAVIDNLKQQLEKMKARFSNITFKIVADQSDFIRHAIKSIGEEAAIGGGLAALLVFLFLGNPTATVGILLSLPVSLLFAFIGLEITGQTLNAMTLGGLALSIGVLVDNAIVVIENITRKLKDGLSPYNAATRGASEVAMPVLSSTLSTMLVLFPVILLQGISKTLFSALSLSVIFAMIGSYFAAMTLIPLFASRFLSENHLNQTHPSKLQSILNLCVNRVEMTSIFYQSLLNKVLDHKKMLFFAVAGLLAIGGVASHWLGSELFPRADAGHFVMRLRMPPGTRIENTEKTATELIAKIKEVIPKEDLEQLVTNIGLIQGLPAAYTSNAGSHDLFMIVQLTEERSKTSQEYAKILREKIPTWFPETEVSFELGGLLSSAINGGLPAPLDVQFIGPKSEESFEIAKKALPLIKAIPGTVDVRIQQQFNAPIIQMNIDRVKASNRGLEIDTIMKSVVSAVDGSTAFNQAIWVDPKTGIDYPFGVRVPEAEFKSAEDLNKIPVRGPEQDRSVPLKDVADFAQAFGANEYGHKMLEPTVDLFVSSIDRDIGSIALELQKIIDQVKLPVGYSISVRGEFEEMKSLVSRFSLGFILAVILVYFLLVIQFKSFVIPVIAMSAVPCGAVGIILMLVLSGTFMSIQAGIGAIFMIGIAVANAVILLEFILHESHHFSNQREAVLSASKARFRPILMTTLASVLGLVPMALGLGKGSEANIPLGRAVIGGQLVSTFMTLFLVPTLFELLIKHKKDVTKQVTQLVVLFVLVSGTAFANETPAEIGVKDYLKKALSIDPSLMSAQLRLTEAQAKKTFAIGSYLPDISMQGLVTAGFPGSAGATGIEGLMVSPYHHGPAAGFVLKQNIFDFGRTASLVNSAESDIHIQTAQVELKKDEIAFELLQAYYACVYDKTFSKDLDYLEGNAVKIYETIVDYVKVGQRSIVESELSKAQLEEIKTLKKEHELKHRFDQEQISLYLSADNKQNAKPVDCPMSEDERIVYVTNKKARDLSPFIKKKEFEVELAKSELQHSYADNLPKIVAIASAGYMQETELGITLKNWSAAAGITLPIFDGFRHSAEIDKTKANLEKAEYELKAEELKYQSQLISLKRLASTMEVRLHDLKSELIVSKKAFEIAAKRFIGLQGNLYDLRESFRNLLRIQQHIRQAEVESNLNKAKISLIESGAD